MKYTMQQIKDSLPNDKKKGDSLIALYIARPLSYPCTLFFVNCGASAWLVSMISVFIAVIGCLCFWADNSIIRWIGCFLVFFWSVLDCVDGNVARVTKSSSEMGSFMDAESGYVISALIYLSFGIAASKTKGMILFDNRSVLIIIGACASICDILARLIHQRYTVSKIMAHKMVKEDEGNDSTFTKLRKKISAEVGIAGFVIIAGIIGELFKVYDIVTCVYCVYSIVSCILVITVYSLKAR